MGFRAHSLLGVAVGIFRLSKENEEIGKIYRKRVVQLLTESLKYSMTNDLLDNSLELATDILKTTIYFCKNAAETEKFFYFDLLYTVCTQLPSKVVSADFLEEVRETRREEIRKMSRNIPLKEKDKLVGIYGMGKFMEKFLKAYQECYEIKADLVFIDSRMPTSKETSDGNEIFNINDIGTLPLDCILICSIKYENEMYRNVSDKYGDRFPVICIGKELKFN